MKFSLVLLLFAVSLISAQNIQIILDENIDDWQNVQTTYLDLQHPNDQLNIDFQELSVTNDQNNLFLLIKMQDEIIFQEFNNIVLYIDTDNDVTTGKSYHGIGAELEFKFGQRQGTFYYNGGSSSIIQIDIGLKSSPTVSSTKFEIALDRSASYNSNNIFTSETIKIVFAQTVEDADQLPDEAGGVEYTFTNTSQYTQNYKLSKSPLADIRIQSYNVHRDDIFDPQFSGKFERILSAISADIIGFQEIYNHTSAEVAALMESIIPSGEGEQWYHANVYPDIIVVSKYKIKSAYQIDGNGAFIIDLRPEFDTDLLLLNAHPPCCQNVESRTAELDNLLSFVRDAQEEGGVLTIEENTPVVILGDMNLVSSYQTQQILTTGNIVDNNTYGPDFIPDWDGTNFEDAKPLTTGVPMTFTWYSEFSSFSPGRLDYMVYSGSVMQLENSFVLFTKGMESDSLSKYGLEYRDVVEASDHLPVVADFSLITPLSLSLQLYPIEVGNKWIYNEYGGSSDIANPEPFNFYYSQEITKDTLLENGYHYYYLESEPFGRSYWIRIDSLTGEVYEKYNFENEEDYLRYDLAASYGDEVETTEGVIYNVVESDTLLWGLNRYSKIFFLYSLFTYQQTFAEGIGITQKLNEFDFGLSTTVLKGCIIDGIVYGDTILVGIEENELELPIEFNLSQNYPNPFNPSTTIKYSIPFVERIASFAPDNVDQSNQSGRRNAVSLNGQERFSESLYNVTLNVYDILGREVATLVNQHQRPGNYEVNFNATSLSSGMYLYTLTVGNFTLTRKMLLMK